MAHPTYDDSSIVHEFKLGAPRPSSSCGQTQTEACETVESGELAIVAVEMTREGDECSCKSSFHLVINCRNAI